MLSTKHALLLMLLLLFLGVYIIPPASAHAVIIPNKSTIGEEQEYIIAVVGEKEQPTVKVEILIPKEFKLVKVIDVAGWEAQSKTDNGLTSVVWVGRLGLDETVKLKLKLKNPSREGLYKFTVIQTYSDGEEVKWNFPGTWVSISAPSLQELILKNLPYLVAAVVIVAVLAVLLLRKK